MIDELFAEWDLGGLPAWLLEMEPSVKLRSSEEQYITQVGTQIMFSYQVGHTFLSLFDMLHDLPCHI